MLHLMCAHGTEHYVPIWMSTEIYPTIHMNLCISIEEFPLERSITHSHKFIGRIVENKTQQQDNENCGFEFIMNHMPSCKAIGRERVNAIATPCSTLHVKWSARGAKETQPVRKINRKKSVVKNPTHNNLVFRCACITYIILFTFPFCLLQNCYVRI